ncbi:hypothetical protein MMC19_001639 [Ptychographa xylographoides]|nr:hypothetical protein [Ptychographa xylographoides]
MAHEAHTLRELAPAHKARAGVIEGVENGMHHDGLAMDGQDAVRRHGDPVVALESQRLARDEDDIGAAIAPLHDEMAAALVAPGGAAAEVQRRRLVRAAADVARADDAVAVRDREVEQRPPRHAPPAFRLRRVVQRRQLGVRHRRHERVDPLDRREHRRAQHRVAEPGPGRCRFALRRALRQLVRVDARPLQAVEEQRERPFGVRAALHAEEPFLAEAEGQRAFDERPGGDAAVVHPHEPRVAEGVAVCVGEGAGGGGAHVGEDQRRSRVGGQTREVDAVPGRDGGGEEARLGAERGRRVVADAEAVAVVGPAGVLLGKRGERELVEWYSE